MTSPFRLRGLAVCHFMKRVHQFKKAALSLFLLQYRHHSAGA
jgi:hypothetical protein